MKSSEWEKHITLSRSRIRESAQYGKTLWYSLLYKTYSTLLDMRTLWYNLLFISPVAQQNLTVSWVHCVILNSIASPSNWNDWYKIASGVRYVLLNFSSASVLTVISSCSCEILRSNPDLRRVISKQQVGFCVTRWCLLAGHRYSHATFMVLGFFAVVNCAKTCR